MAKLALALLHLASRRRVPRLCLPLLPPSSLRRIKLAPCHAITWPRRRTAAKAAAPLLRAPAAVARVTPLPVPITAGANPVAHAGVDPGRCPAYCTKLSHVTWTRGPLGQFAPKDGHDSAVRRHGLGDQSLSLQAGQPFGDARWQLRRRTSGSRPVAHDSTAHACPDPRSSALVARVTLAPVPISTLAKPIAHRRVYVRRERSPSVLVHEAHERVGLSWSTIGRPGGDGRSASQPQLGPEGPFT
jgi:hypothetical protein